MYVLVKLHLPNTWEKIGVYNTWEEAIAAQSRYGGPDSFIWGGDDWMKVRGIDTSDWDTDPQPF